jgi:16S rRNA (guanine527-N7)-methyltransferase
MPAGWWSFPDPPGTLRPPLDTDRGVARLIADLSGAIGVPLGDDQVRLLARYLDLVALWRRRARLTAVSDPLEAARVHVADSLLCLRAGIPLHSTVVDVGSGAGLPGIPLLVARPDLSVTLVEPSQRRAAFLEMACGELGLAAEVVPEPAERLGQDPRWREAFDVAVARAVAPLAVLVELVLPLVRPGGKAILLKGAAARQEVRQAARAVEEVGGGTPALVEASVPTGPARTIVVIPKISPTPRRYPRRPGTPRRRPLA